MRYFTLFLLAVLLSCNTGCAVAVADEEDAFFNPTVPHMKESSVVFTDVERFSSEFVTIFHVLECIPVVILDSSERDILAYTFGADKEHFHLAIRSLRPDITPEVIVWARYACVEDSLRDLL